MKAAVVTGFDRPLHIEELPQPVPAPDQMLAGDWLGKRVAIPWLAGFLVREPIEDADGAAAG